MNFFNQRRGNFAEFDNNFNSNWGENYYPDNTNEWGSGFDTTCNKHEKYQMEDEVYEGKFFCTRRQNSPRPCGRPCNRTNHRPCNRPCFDEWEDDCNGYDRPTHRPCKGNHAPCNNGNQNCNDALLFLSGYFIAKRCR